MGKVSFSLHSAPQTQLHVAKGRENRCGHFVKVQYKYGEKKNWLFEDLDGRFFPQDKVKLYYVIHRGMGTAAFTN